MSVKLDDYGEQNMRQGGELPCEDCGTPTNEVKADIHRCVRCEHQMLVEREREYTSARYCDYCNP